MPDSAIDTPAVLPPRTEAVRVVLVDDHDALRYGVAQWLERDAGVTVVGEASDGDGAVVAARELAPDVVVLDVKLDEADGVDICRQVLEVAEDLKVLAFSGYEDRDCVRRMFAAGAAGFAVKSSHLDELQRAVHVVARGGTYLSPALAHVVVAEWVAGAPPPARPTASVTDDLTVREQEVLRLLAEGRSARHLGAVLGISPKTVHVHRSRIMEKLKIDNVPDLVKYALRTGLVSL